MRELDDAWHTLEYFHQLFRTDSAFVDRLEADLKARSFRPWVDRSKLEGGQPWMDELEKAIDRCQIVIVVVSPDAVQQGRARSPLSSAMGKKRRHVRLNICSACW